MGVGVSKRPRSSSLTSIQKCFALYDAAGEIWVVDKDEIAGIKSGLIETSVSFYKKASAEIKLKRLCEQNAFQEEPKALLQQFWVSSKTHVYRKTAFSPVATLPDTINFWVDPAPGAKGDWSVIRNFLLEVICGKNQAVFEYLLKYLGHMLQHPEEKPGIMIVLLGSQGTGKGTFFKLISKIWHQTMLEVNDVDHVIGNFNAILEQKYVICMDEALFAGDRKKLERLKSLITEPTCRIEQKYQPARIINSYHRFFAASNNDQFAHIELDDRRFLFLRVANCKQGDSKYFDELLKCIEDPATIAAMVYDLMSIDLTNFNVRARPSTREHLSQKIQSLTGFDRYWFEVLQSGSTNGSDDGFLSEWSEPMFISSTFLLKQYKAHDKNSERYASTQTSQIVQKILKLCPSARQGKGKSKGLHTQKQVRGFYLPSLNIARQEFEKILGGSVTWPDVVAQEVLKAYLVHEGAHP
jgi:hypothetical protein